VTRGSLQARCQAMNALQRMPVPLARGEAHDAWIPVDGTRGPHEVMLLGACGHRRQNETPIPIYFVWQLHVQVRSE